MANNIQCSTFNELDPVQGLLDYIATVKPFHTKVVEVMVEYSYVEPLVVSMYEHLDIQIEVLQPLGSEFSKPCYAGYGCLLYGSPFKLPILSPFYGKTVEQFPGIDTTSNKIFLPGDRRADFAIGTEFQIVHNIEDVYQISKIHDVGPTHFIVEEIGEYGFLASTFAVNDIFYTTGLRLDDEVPFQIVSVVPDTPSVGYTRVNVNVTLNTSVPAGYFGLRKTLGNNNATFSVRDLIYNDSALKLFPHTVVFVNEPLNPLSTGLNSYKSHQLYVEKMPPLPVSIVKVLSHSNFAEPDEGLINADIIDVTVSTLDGFGIAVPGTGSFTISGDITDSNIFVGEPFYIANSSRNNGSYTITSLDYNGTEDETTIYVVENVRSDAVEGTVRIKVPSNMFFVDGNFTNYFHEGVPFEINGGTFAGKYTVLYSEFVNEQTRIRPTRNIFNIGSGEEIINVTSSTTFEIDGDLTSALPLGANINIVGSPTNDGAYTVASSTFSAGNTTVTVNESILDSVAGGEMFIPIFGQIESTGIDIGFGGYPISGFSGYMYRQNKYDIVSANATSNIFHVDGDVSQDIFVDDYFRVDAILNSGLYKPVLVEVYGSPLQSYITVENITYSVSGGTLSRGVLEEQYYKPCAVTVSLSAFFDEHIDFKWDIEDFFQFILISANSTTNQIVVVGDVTSDIPSGGQFRIIGTANASNITSILYTAIGTPVYNPSLNHSTIQVTSIIADYTPVGSPPDIGAWIEHI